MEFISTGKAGYSDTVQALPGVRLARKRERAVRVHFATLDTIVESREGIVHARAGDAILTGTQGEHWRVSKAHFASKYRAELLTQSGEDGTYVSRAYEVRVVAMREPFRVLLADGHSRLTGATGDWLVDYGDGSLGIVAQAIFPGSYELLD